MSGANDVHVLCPEERIEGGLDNRVDEEESELVSERLCEEKSKEEEAHPEAKHTHHQFQNRVVLEVESVRIAVGYEVQQ